MNIVEDPNVTVKCRTARTIMFLYFNFCLSVVFDNVLCSFASFIYHFYLMYNVGPCCENLLKFSERPQSLDGKLGWNVLFHL